MASSFNELFGLGSHSANANLEGWWPLQDDAASTAVVDASGQGRHGVLVGGENTSAKSTTGPNGWLTKAFDLNGSDDYVSIADDDGFSFGDGSDDDGMTLLIRSAATGGGGSSGNLPLISKYQSSSGPFNGEYAFQASSGGSVVFQTLDDFTSIRCRQDTATGVHPLNGSWNRYSARYDGSSVDEGIVIRKNKSDVASTGFGQDGSYVAMHNLTSVVSIGANLFVNGPSGYHDGPLCDAAIFRGALVTGDIDQWEDGPEPINSVAPAVSGTETEGETLSVTTGTWGLDAPFSGGTNGTITYAYQWTRSDDGTGTGEADIGSATSNTYTLVSADVGKFIRCRVRASNDGGFDADADTNSDFTGEIQAGGGGTGNRRRRFYIGAAS